MTYPEPIWYDNPFYQAQTITEDSDSELGNLRTNSDSESSEVEIYQQVSSVNSVSASAEALDSESSEEDYLETINQRINHIEHSALDQLNDLQKFIDELLDERNKLKPVAELPIIEDLSSDYDEESPDCCEESVKSQDTVCTLVELEEYEDLSSSELVEYEYEYEYVYEEEYTELPEDYSIEMEESEELRKPTADSEDSAESGDYEESEESEDSEDSEVISLNDIDIREELSVEHRPVSDTAYLPYNNLEIHFTPEELELLLKPEPVETTVESPAESMPVNWLNLVEQYPILYNYLSTIATEHPILFLQFMSVITMRLNVISLVEKYFDLKNDVSFLVLANHYLALTEKQIIHGQTSPDDILCNLVGYVVDLSRFAAFEIADNDLLDQTLDFLKQSEKFVTAFEDLADQFDLFKS